MSATYGISVKDFGAVGDGVTDDQPALQEALNEGAPLVVVPYGVYPLGQGLHIGSGTRLTVHPQARLIFGDGAGRSQDDFLLTNRNHDAGNQSITVEGGIWDGNNPANPRGPDAPGSYSGVMMNFTNVADLTLRAMTLIDAESYFVRLGKVSDFLIEDIAFEINSLRPNQDGIHVSGHCADGIMRGLEGRGQMTPNDDMAALLADDALHRAQNLNGAFNGPIRRIRVEKLRAASCHSFIRLLSVDHPIEDIEINDVKGGCRCCAINMDACRECRVKLFDDAARPEGVGSISNVRVSDMEVYKATDTSHQPLIDFRTHAEGFRMVRFRRDRDRDVSPSSPTLCIEKAGDVALAIEGFSGPLADAHVQPIATNTGTDAFRAERNIASNETFIADVDGFDLLTVFASQQ